MSPRKTLSRLALRASLIGVAALGACDASQFAEPPPESAAISSTQQAIGDVPHAAVERQSIGNCWIYAQASWVESMALAANPDKELDISQSYWTYWHWFDQVTSRFPPPEIRTGGFQFTSHSLVRDRGLMLEDTFVPADSESEMSQRQSSALSTINAALKNGEFAGANSEKVRQIFDDAWGLDDDVRKHLDKAFGTDGETTLRQGASLEGTIIVDPATLAVRYTERVNNKTETRDGNLLDAVRAWNQVSFPTFGPSKRSFLRRVQRALHDNQPVVLTWSVDFNALENSNPERQGSFNMETLKEAGRPGGQGGHMTVLEDYEAETVEFGVLPAGVTLDASKPEDAKRLEAALLDSSSVRFLRTKNSWGANRPDREFAEGFPGYHDLWMDYLEGPIRYCPDQENATNESCTGETVPLRTVLLPPGY